MWDASYNASKHTTTVEMASPNSYSHSPRVPRRLTPPTAASPFTPVHSPHHSVASSASSRTPIHVLSIHEYRKQQNDPTSLPTTITAGKTLRRKPAAPALHDAERVPSLTRSDFHSARRPLQGSRSAQQLIINNSVLRRASSTEDHRPHTTEPISHSDYQDGVSGPPRVRHFNTRKRLPRPSAATGSGSLLPSYQSAPSLSSHRLRLASSSESQTEVSNSSDAKTASTFSLSKFPQPPQSIDSWHSPPLVDAASTPIPVTLVTPPATPATIHYRGASFDLVNPHNSLLLHDIVTPSRDFDSSEYFRVPSFEEPFVVTPEMAPKRPLYGDYNSAHAGIMRSNPDLPPTPTMYTPESDLVPSPLVVKETLDEPRFSIKQLTRSLTSRLAKDPRIDNTQELQDLAKPAKSASESFIENTYHPITPPSLTTPTTPYSPVESDAALASMIPDDFSIEQGRFDTGRTSQQRMDSRPYYDDLDSIYAGSSIYSTSEQRRSAYPQSLESSRPSYAVTVLGDPERFSLDRNNEENTDTISKIIDHYDPGDATPDAGAYRPPLNHRNSDFYRTGEPSMAPKLGRHPGEPPAEEAPSAPAILFDEQSWGAPGLMSVALTHSSLYSYSDTRNLLQIRSNTAPMALAPLQLLQTSSSYSQPYVPSRTTPQIALEHAEQIFDGLPSEVKPCAASIPAMWTRRTSGSQLFSKRGNESSTLSLASDIGDWESLRESSQGERRSLDSIANYSSSDDDTPESLGKLNGSSLPTWPLQAHSQNNSIYSHPSPIQQHHNPFNSSPPLLQPTSRLQVLAHREDRMMSPWTDPYAFSDKETQELLASGPNDKIMIDHRDASTSTRHPQSSVSRGAFEEPAISGNVFNEGGRLDRENTFEKMCVVGPRGNLTGTPRGTGMQEAGSSIADTSSPGIDLTSSASRRSSRYPGFYATPFAAIGSVTRVHRSHLSESIEPTHAPSEVTLFPKGGDDDSGRSLHKNRPLSLRCSTTFEKTQRRTSRTAVPGQTKLREMMLSPKTNRKHVGSQDTTFSRFMGGSERPSTSDTMTPLQRKRSIEISSFVPPVDTRHYSPHLLCPERAVTPEVEHRQQKLSWIILGVFCLLPPCIFLYRIWGDHIISSVTHGQIPDCTAKSKRMALIAGIVVNIALIVAIIVPVVVAVALGVA